MTPEFTICIPWRPSPSRMKPFEKVRAYWEENFPGVEIIPADSDSEIFSLSQARNNAVRQAKTDIVLVADADTVVLPIENVRTAVEMAVVDPQSVCWPHRVWRLVPHEFSDRPFDHFPNAPVLTEHPEGLGGCMVTTADEYWRLGGQDERFEGWGHEDRAFHCVVMTLSTFRRIGGIAYSIEHNHQLRAADSPGWNRDSQPNRHLVLPYENATGKPWLMRELLRIRAEEELEQAGGDWRARSGANEQDPIRRQLFAPRKPSPPPQQPDWHARWGAHR